MALVIVAMLGFEHFIMEFLFHEIGLYKMTMSSMNERDTHHIQTHSSARGIVKGVGDFRSGGLSLFLLCAGANRI